MRRRCGLRRGRLDDENPRTPLSEIETGKHLGFHAFDVDLAEMDVATRLEVARDLVQNLTRIVRQAKAA